MTYLYYLIVCLGITVLQTTIFPNFSFFENFYDLLIPFVLYVGLYRSFIEGLPVVLFFGFVMDSFSGAPFGFYIILYFWFYLGIRWLIQFLHAGNVILLPFVIALGVIMENTGFFCIVIMLGKNTDGLSGDAAHIIVFQALWAILTGPIILMLISFIHKKWEAWVSGLSTERRNRDVLR